MQFYRGDIFYVEHAEYSAESDFEKRETRPAVIVSSDYGNRASKNVTVVYLTSAEKRPMAVHANVICKIPCTALCEAVYTVNKDRLRDWVKTCTPDEMRRIDAALMCALGINSPAVPTERIKELEALLSAEKGNSSVYKARMEEAEKARETLELQLKEAEATLADTAVCAPPRH